MVSNYRQAYKILGVVMCFALVFVTFSCQRDFSEFELCEKYSIVSVDVESNSLSFNLGEGSFIERVSGEIVSLEWGDRYIIAERKNDEWAGSLYYILDKERDHRYADPEESVSGPLSAFELDVVRKEKKIPEVLPHKKNL